jgi:hypothetical protein
VQDVDICNLALGLCAGDTIASLAENTPMGLFCRDQYPQKRAYLLGIYRWVFATQTQPLTRVDGAALPADRRPASYAFVKPTDIIGVVHSYRDQAAIDGSRQLTVIENDGRYWCSESAVWVEYTALKDESTWPSWFVELVKVAFAADVARRLQNNSLAQTFQEQAFGSPGEGRDGGLFSQARAADGRAAPSRQLFCFDDGALINARFEGGGGVSIGGFVNFN